MSHFTRLRTLIRDEEVLTAALMDVGFQEVERHSTPQHLYGYQGDIRPETAEVIIRRQHIGGASNDIGFKKQENETFEAVISEFDRRAYSQDWLDRVAQRYAYHTTCKTIVEEGYVVEDERILENGEIELVVCEDF